MNFEPIAEGGTDLYLSNERELEMMETYTIASTKTNNSQTINSYIYRNNYFEYMITDLKRNYLNIHQCNIIFKK